MLLFDKHLYHYFYTKVWSVGIVMLELLSQTPGRLALLLGEDDDRPAEACLVAARFPRPMRASWVSHVASSMRSGGRTLWFVVQGSERDGGYGRLQSVIRICWLPLLSLRGFL